MDEWLTQVNHVMRRAAEWVANRETWCVLPAIPPLLLSEFLSPLIPLSVMLIAALFTCRLITRRLCRLGGWLDLAMAILVLMLPISLWVSSDPQRSFPKFTTTLIGMFLFWSLGTGLQRLRDAYNAAILLALSGIGLAGLGLVGTDWPRSKLFYISSLYDLLPRLTFELPRSTRGRFDANEVAGALVLLLPLVVTVLLYTWSTRRQATALRLSNIFSYLRILGFTQWPGLLIVLLTITLLAMALVFILTQSRGAMGGLLAAIVVLLVLSWRRLLILIGSLLAAGILWDISIGERWIIRLWSIARSGDSLQARLAMLLDMAESFFKIGGGSTAVATGRVEMWSNALHVIADYPLTGSGFHTFPAVSWANYVYTVVSPAFNMTHAHNAYLQAGVDFGVAGLFAYLLLLVILLRKGALILHNKPSALAVWVTRGIIAGISGHLVHSMVDAVARPLGDKPGIIFWAMAGLVVAMERLCGQANVLASTESSHSERVQHVGSAVLPRWWSKGLLQRLMVACKDSRRRLLLESAIGLAAILILVFGWGIVIGVLAPVSKLNLGALALDQARLKPGLTAQQRAALLNDATRWLTAALPWRSSTVYLRLGIVMDEQGRKEAARAYWSKTPRALPYLLAQGDARLALGKIAEARAYFEHALAIAPTSSSAHYRLGLVAARERPLEAITSFQQALALDNFEDPAMEKGKTYMALASLLGAQGQWAQAVEIYQMQAASGQFSAHSALAWAMYQRDGDARGAEAYLRTMIGAGSQQVDIYVGLIRILYADGRSDEAITVGNEAIRRFPEFVEPLLAVGNIYMAQEAYAEAEKMFEQAVVLRPRSAEIRFLVGQAALKQGKIQAALAAFVSAIELAPNDARYYASLGDAQRLAGQVEAAAEAYRQALALDPGNTAAKQGLEGLPR